VNRNIPSILLITLLTFIGCAPARTYIVAENANMKSSLEELSSYDNDKSKIVKMLPKVIGNMELFNVVDYTKKYVIGPDFGYGVFYDLKNNRHGSGNIFLYKRDKQHVENGISNDALIELKAERRDVEKADTTNAEYSIVKFGNLDFYQMKFVTPPDRQNNQYDGYFFISGVNGVYVKILFYYSKGAEYGEEETNLFMNTLSSLLSNSEPK
jgi:hypothetical protein